MLFENPLQFGKISETLCLQILQSEYKSFPDSLEPSIVRKLSCGLCLLLDFGHIHLKLG